MLVYQLRCVYMYMYSIARGSDYYYTHIPMTDMTVAPANTKIKDPTRVMGFMDLNLSSKSISVAIRSTNAI